MKPAKPRKARPIRAATIKDIGSPLRDSGIGAISSLSLIEPIRTIARRKPEPLLIAKTIPDIRPKSLSIFKKATPSIAQFVVIRGRNIPRAEYKPGNCFLKNNSRNWTREAITRIKTTVLRYIKSKGRRIYWYRNQVITVAIVITKITLMPIELAVFISLETPKKGHSPKNFIKIILFTRKAERNIKNILSILFPPVIE
jgi:hypothetical protein